MNTLLAYATGSPSRAVLAVLVLLSFGIYSRLNGQEQQPAVLMTRLDDVIPFWPAFSLPYLLYFPFLFFIVVYGIMETPYFAQIAATTLAVQLIAAVVYGLRQTYVPRPAVTGRGIFSRLTALVYRVDRPYCTFPSLHVAYSVLCGYWAAVMFPQLLPFFVLFAASIVLSTMFIKQHALADVLAGASVAVLCLAIVG